MKKLSLTYFFGAFLLICFGLYLVMSASSTISASKFSNQFYLFNNHLVKVIFGLILMIAFSFIPYEFYKSYSKPIIILALFLLALTLLLSMQIKGARRWLDLGFINFQPADFAKIALFIHLSKLIEEKGDEIKNFNNGFRYAFIWILTTVGLILAQPNISTGLLLLLVSFVVLFVSGAKLKHIFSSLFVSGFIVFFSAMIFSHSRSRILTFINSLINGGDINIQVKQALLGLGSGGVFGVGFGNSSQRNLFLPEAYGDFIFAILGEETGFVGAVTVLSIYLILFLIGILIAKKVKDKFGQMLALSISLSIAINAFVNASVASGLIPTTGLPLPLISYGGSSIVILCISIGILLNIGITNSKLQIIQEPALNEK